MKKQLFPKEFLGASIEYYTFKIKSRMGTLISCLLLLTISLNAFSQEVVFVNCKNANPVDFAHVQNITTKSMAITNETGQVLLNLTNNTDSLYISHIGYYGAKTTVGAVLQQDTFCLAPREFVLDAVHIVDSSPEQILLKALKSTTEKLMLPAMVSAYYKEFITRDGEYVSFSDADMGFYVGPHKKDRVEISGILKGSRVFAPPVEKDEFDIDLVSPVGFEKTMSYYDPANTGKFLNPENFDKYTYDLNVLEDSYLIRITPSESEEALFRGEVSINMDDYTIRTVRYAIDEKKKQFTNEVNALVARIRLLDHFAILEYGSLQGQIYPVFIRTEYALSIKNNKNIDQVNSFINDIHIYEVPEEQVAPDRRDTYRKKSIVKNGTSYEDTYWEKSNFVNLTEREKDIIGELADDN